MTIHDRLEAFWSGEKPDRIPYTVYWWEWKNVQGDPAWRAMFDAGLGVTQHVATFAAETPGVEHVNESKMIDGVAVDRHTMRTPVGEIHAEWANGWCQKYWLRTADDYRVMTWIARHTQIRPNYDEYRKLEKEAPPYLVPLVFAGRTPMQSILVDFVGLENFALHLFDLEDALLELYDAMRRNVRLTGEIVAGGPGRFVAILENFTAETLGPARYERFHLPVYDEVIAMMHQAGKIVGTHYDGKLSSCRDQIARAPMDLIESFTTPPEGDMSVGEARAAWPRKLLWANINVSCYGLPANELRGVVRRMVEQGAPDGRRLAFEVSEHMPVNWKESIPVVMDELRRRR